MNKQIVIRDKSTGLYFMGHKGFAAAKREHATSYNDTAAIRASFNAQCAGELQFICEKPTRRRLRAS